jgi:predicted peroxiredoxin
MGAIPEIANIDELVNRRLEELLPQKLEEALRSREESKTPSMAIIATRGTLDWAYPPFILGSTAAALGWDVSIFFTFYGLNLLKKDVSDLKVSPLGNPGMPMKMPFGPEWFKGINWNIPNIIQAGVPGFENRGHHADAADHQEQRRRHDRRTCVAWRRRPTSSSSPAR